MLRWGGVTACRRVSQRDGVGAWEPHILRLMRTEQMHSESSPPDPGSPSPSLSTLEGTPQFLPLPPPLSRTPTHPAPTL